MSDKRIRVGFIGAGGWARYGHMPALQLLDEFEITAVAARRRESAENAARLFGIAAVYDDPQAVIDDPNVDLVVVMPPTSERVRYVKAVIAAGKDVYSEWPLTTTTAESKELLALAMEKGVHHVIGLQRRLGPSARYARDLVKQGYVGRIRAAHISVGTDAFQPVMPGAFSWTFDVASFTNVLSIYAGHHLDTLFQIVGRPSKLTAITETQFDHITVEETGEQVPNHNPNEVMVIGTLDGGGLFSAQLEGGQAHPTGIQIDVTGTDGVLRITNAHAFQNPDDNTVEGVTSGGTARADLPVPDEYRNIPQSDLDESTLDVAHLYAAFARDRQNGTSEAPTFKDAVRQHELIDQIAAASKQFSTPLL
jgi:predicted dehydrogenase